MVGKLIEWAAGNRLVVFLLATALAAVGAYAFVNINVEAYPDPAPSIIEVLAQWPGASAEEMERQVTTPLEITLAGMPGLKGTYSKSLFGLSHLRNVFHYGHDYEKARQMAYRSQTLHFHAPVHIGDVVTVIVEVIELVPEGRKVRLACEASVDGRVVLDGEAVVSVPGRA